MSILNALVHSQEIRIGLEATGHYGDNLMPFLNEHGYSFMQFNPYLIKKVSDSFTLCKTKTDKLDAMTIIVHNPTFYEYYSKKHHKEGKNHRVALSHVVRKLLRIIYHIEVMDKKFDSKLLK